MLMEITLLVPQSLLKILEPLMLVNTHQLPSMQTRTNFTSRTTIKLMEIFELLLAIFSLPVMFILVKLATEPMWDSIHLLELIH